MKSVSTVFFLIMILLFNANAFAIFEASSHEPQIEVCSDCAASESTVQNLSFQKAQSHQKECPESSDDCHMNCHSCSHSGFQAILLAATTQPQRKVEPSQLRLSIAFISKYSPSSLYRPPII